MQISFRDEAARDLEAVHSWIALDRPEIAAQVIDQILRNVETMALFPRLGHSGTVPGTLEWITPGLPYIIVYQVETRQQDLQEHLTVLAIFHCAQDRSG